MPVHLGCCPSPELHALLMTDAGSFLGDLRPLIDNGLDVWPSFDDSDVRFVVNSQARISVTFDFRNQNAVAGHVPDYLGDKRDWTFEELQGPHFRTWLKESLAVAGEHPINCWSDLMRKAGTCWQPSVPWLLFTRGAWPALCVDYLGFGPKREVICLKSIECLPSALPGPIFEAIGFARLLQEMWPKFRAEVVRLIEVLTKHGLLPEVTERRIPDESGAVAIPALWVTRSNPRSRFWKMLTACFDRFPNARMPVFEYKRDNPVPVRATRHER